MGRVSGKRTVYFEEYILKYYYCLQFSPAVETVVKESKKNPKRMQRDAKKQMQENGNRECLN